MTASRRTFIEGLAGGGVLAASGVYFYRLSTLGRTLTRKMVLLR